MSERNETFEEALHAITEWEGETPELWKRALDADDAPPQRPEIRPWYLRRSFAAAAAGLALFASAIMMNSVGESRHSVAGPRSAAVPERRMVGHVNDLDGMRSPTALGSVPSIENESRGRGVEGLPSPASRASLSPTRSSDRQDDSVRAVVRKATMELTLPDVRAAALKAQQLLSQPQGEYVESADIDDSDPDRPRADLVLRVAAARLEAYLTELRELGEVKTERIDGEDVNDQLIDIGARLESEQRVEHELIELLETRNNDALEDILAVRRELNAVRERIERLAAQHDGLSRLVALARVTLLIRAEPVPPPAEPSKGTWSTFVDDLGTAWDDGLSTMLGTIAVFVRVIVSGAIWLAIAAIAIFWAIRVWRREHPKALAV